MSGLHVNALGFGAHPLLLAIPAAWIVFLVWWIVAAFRVKRTAVRPGQWWTLRVVAVAIAIDLIIRQHGGIATTLVARRWPYSTALAIVADVLVLGGLALAIWARTIIGRNWSAMVVLKQDHELIDRGPYAVVRHPIYSAIMLMLAGSALAAAQWLWIIVAVAAVVGFTFKARAEERLLTTHFPQAYPAYRRRVRGAIVPFVL